MHFLLISWSSIFQSLNHLGINLKALFLIKSGYYIVPSASTTLTFFSAVTSDRVYLQMIFRLKIFISKNYNVSNLWSIPFIIRKLVLNFMLRRLDEVKYTYLFCFSWNNLGCYYIWTCLSTSDWLTCRCCNIFGNFRAVGWSENPGVPVVIRWA